MVKAGIKNVCVHKGLFAPSVEHQFPNLRGFVDVSDVGQAAKDWPQLNFIIYHGGYRHVGGDPKVALAEFERTGRISWTSDLADIPAHMASTMSTAMSDSCSPRRWLPSRMSVPR